MPVPYLTVLSQRRSCQHLTALRMEKLVYRDAYRLYQHLIIKQSWRFDLWTLLQPGSRQRRTAPRPHNQGRLYIDMHWSCARSLLHKRADKGI